jgi:hypothetical protein
LTSYSELLDEVPRSAFARNAELINDMDKVVARAQAYVVKRLDHDAFRGDYILVTIDETGQFARPPDMLELRAVQVRFRGRGWLPLRRRSEEMLAALFTGPRARPGMPEYYAETPEGFDVFPRPPRPIEARVLWNQDPPILGPAQDTNVLTDGYPEVIRAAVMREAAIYMGDATLIQVYSGEATETLGAANLELARRRRDESGTRSRDTGNAQGQ